MVSNLAAIMPESAECVQASGNRFAKRWHLDLTG
jgi:hypothetical protein